MLKRKKLWSLVAAAMLVTACGGGGGGGGDNGDAGPDPVVGGGGGADDGNTPPGNNPPGNNPPDNNPPDNNPVVDQQLQGYLRFVANQLQYITADRNEYRPVAWGNAPYDAATLETFELGWLDNETNIRHPINIADGGTPSDANSRVRPEIYAPAAPIASLGIRVSFQTHTDTDANQTGAQTVVGRVAFQFVERADSHSIAAGQDPERISFIIDNVQLRLDAAGQVAGAEVLPGGRLHLAAVTATGTSINGAIPFPRDQFD